MGIYLIWASITIGFIYISFILWDIKLTLNYRNELLEEQNDILNEKL
jgi:hypothetical protein